MSTGDWLTFAALSKAEPQNPFYLSYVRMSAVAEKRYLAGEKLCREALENKARLHRCATGATAGFLVGSRLDGFSFLPATG